MLRFILRRLFIETIPTLLCVAALTFFLIRMAPGGPFATEKSIAPEVLSSLNAHYGFDKPLPVQFVTYLSELLHGRLGPSLRYPNRTVNELIANAFPVSCELGLYALLVALTGGIILGIIASLKHNRAGDYAAMATAMVGLCLPTFVMGPLFVLVFGLWLQWLPVEGWEHASSKVLPSFTLGLAYLAYVARLTRGGMLEVLHQDYIRTARAKGLSERVVIWRHALRGGLVPVISFLGPAVAGLITGSFVVETIFNIPGLGRVFVLAAFNRDYTLIMGTVLFYAVLIIMLNTVVDIVQAVLDVRVREGL